MRDNRKLLYTKIYSLQYSFDEKYIAAGNSYGEIALFSVSSALGADLFPDSKRPFRCFRASSSRIFSLASLDNTLISGGGNVIHGFRWNELTTDEAREPQPAWTINISAESPLDGVLTTSVNGKRLLAGCEDGLIRSWDTGTLKPLTPWNAHEGAVRALCEVSTGLLSAGADGILKLWDSRSEKCVIQRQLDTARPELGAPLHFICADGEWVVCGGAVKPTVFYLRQLTPVQTIPCEGVCRSATFFAGRLATCSSRVQLWELGGDPQCVAEAASGLRWTCRASDQLLATAGSNPSIELFSRRGYRATTLSWV